MRPCNLEIVAYAATDLGPLCLRRRELLSSPGTVVTEVTLDNQFLRGPTTRRCRAAGRDA